MINYQEDDVTSILSASKQKYNFVLDNVGRNFELYWKSPDFTKPGAKYVQIGSDANLSSVYDIAFRFLVPTSLGGGQRPFSFGMAATNFEHFTEIGELLVEGKVKPTIDEVFDFEDVPKAYRKLKTGRAKGKIVVRIRSDDKK